MTCWLATLNIERFFLQFRLPAESAREWCVWSMHIWELSRVKTSNMYMQSARQSRIRRGRVELSMLYVKLKWLEIDFEMAFLAAAERIDVVVKRVCFEQTKRPMMEKRIEISKYHQSSKWSTSFYVVSAQCRLSSALVSLSNTSDFSARSCKSAVVVRSTLSGAARK